MGMDFRVNEYGEIIRGGEAKTKKTNWWSIVSLLLFFVICILSYALYESYESNDSLYWQYNRLYDELQSKEQEINTLQEELSLISEDGFGIYSIELGNHDYYGNTITGYGCSLYSSKMRYLMPRIIYYATRTKTVVFQYKIFYPDGTLMYNSDYSEEYTGDSHRVTLYAGKKNKVELGGWGNRKESTYHPGTYSIEIWYNGKCIKKQSFEILE